MNPLLRLVTSSTKADTYNPATGELYKTYTLMTQDEAEEVVEAAHTAFKHWRRTPLSERTAIIRKIGKLLKRDKTELAEMMTRQMGKPIAEAEGEIDVCIEICNYTADNAEKYLSDETRKAEGTKKALITYQPMGVILGMQPWNFPFYQCMRYSIAAIAAGNTTVFKHATICIETAERIQKLYEEAGLPKDVFSVVKVDDETADKLIAHPKVRGVTFTGSAAAGKIVAREAGAHLKKTVMELGGSDAYIVLADTNIDDIIETCVKGRTNNAGQTCIAAKRFIIEEAVYDEFKEKFVKAMKSLKYGDPMDRENDMGPLARADLQDNLHNQVEGTGKKGATLLCGGTMPETDGCYYPPTVLENIPEGTPARDDELFGPVASLFKVKTAQDAIDLANSHRYGLGGGIFTSNEDHAVELARTEMDTGMVHINSYGLAKPNMPFGGVKDSGYGREHGGFGLREFVNIKSVFVGK